MTYRSCLFVFLVACMQQATAAEKNPDSGISSYNESLDAPSARQDLSHSDTSKPLVSLDGTPLSLRKYFSELSRYLRRDHSGAFRTKLTRTIPGEYVKDTVPLIAISIRKFGPEGARGPLNFEKNTSRLAYLQPAALFIGAQILPWFEEYYSNQALSARELLKKNLKKSTSSEQLQNEEKTEQRALKKRITQLEKKAKIVRLARHALIAVAYTSYALNNNKAYTAKTEGHAAETLFFYNGIPPLITGAALFTLGQLLSYWARQHKKHRMVGIARTTGKVLTGISMWYGATVAAAAGASVGLSNARKKAALPGSRAKTQE